MRYAWKRFWCPREGVMNLSDGGFLFDPESEHANLVAPDVVSFDTIAHLPCQALLGEPGIGKTTAMEDLRNSLQQSVTEAGDALLYVNLNEYGDESRLICDVFESEFFVAWTRGRHVLYLFLDSLDECRLRITQIATIIKNRMRQISEHLPRLRLRIACRTADWPDTLEQSLTDIWGKDGYGAFELAPLRRRDVQLAAEARGVDATHFLAEVARTETAAFANKPITLRFLLTAFKDDGQLPASRRELYERGCKMLCDEWNPDRRNPGEAGALSAEQRLAVASRIAAVSVFCRKPTIVTGPVPSNMMVEEIQASALVGGDETAGAGLFEVTNDALQETLGTGLFNARGPQRLGFAHQTYAEFLASRYLASHRMETGRKLSLLRHPDDPNGFIVPQLTETAAWVASNDKGILNAIVKCDPQVLLRGDAASLTDVERQMIVEALLLALHERRANDRDWDLHRQYGKLKHDGLADQLRPWITDPTKHYTARDTAIDIAKACELRELQDALVNIALDQTETLRLRDSAAHAITKIADADTRLRLLPLALGQAGDDPQDQLKGNALRALWPDLISAEDLFQNLTLPKQDNFHGAYFSFLEFELTKHLAPEYLPCALQWLKSLVAQKRLGYFLHRVADEIMIIAWQHIDAPGVLKALAETSIEYFRHHHDLLHDRDTRERNQDILDDPGRRRLLAAKIVELSQDQHTRFELTSRSPRLIRDEDFYWCTEQLEASIGKPPEPTWAELTWSLFCWGESDPQRLDTIIHSRANSACMMSESELFFTPVELDSERALKMKTHWEDVCKWQEKPPSEPLNPPPTERIEHWLGRSENGEPNVWWVLLREMTLEDTSTHYGTVPLDIRRLPGWLKATTATKTRMLEAADRFLRHGSVDPLKWLREPHSWGVFHTAGYAALFILKQEAKDVYDSLPCWVWERHVATVLCSPFFDEDGEVVKEHEEIALRCYEQARDAFLFYLPLQLDAEDRDGRHVSCDCKIGLCWDEDLRKALCEKLVEGQAYWKPATFDHVVTLLLAHEHGPTRNLLIRLVQAVADEANTNSEHARIAAAGLIKHSPDAAWSTIWPAVEANPDFGRDLLMTVAHGLHHNAGEVATKLTELQLAGLFIWLAREFPYSQDPDRGAAYFAGPDDSVRDFRNALVGFLENKGTPSAVTALERASNALPDLDWLRSTVIEARKNTLRKTWSPLAPQELLELAANPSSSLVRNADELQTLVLDALAVLEERLQGETPQAFALWDQIGRTRGQEKFRPKDENHLSDWIKSNLETELQSWGVIVAREVEIRRGEGSGTGERTDIHVTAVVPGLDTGSTDTVRVIIEVKGCWNPELQTAMQAQLVDRYLKDNQCQHGIYLVGWYLCDQWDDSHRQKIETLKLHWSIDDANAFFTTRADGMPTDVMVKAKVIDTRLR